MRNLDAIFILALGLMLFLGLANTNKIAHMESPKTIESGVTYAQLFYSIPQKLRQSNYSPYGEGSCVHASTITLLRWQGLDEWADWWRATYNSEEWSHKLITKLDGSGLRYAYTRAGDVEFLEWACRNRLYAGVFYFKNHAVNIVKLDNIEAVLIDNNDIGNAIHIPRNEFIRRWRNEFSGFAWTIVYSPPPPVPTWG